MPGARQDDENLDLLLGFVEEGLEMLEEVEPRLIVLEKGASGGAVDPEVLNTIFRLFHSLKGSAGYLGLETVSRVTHTAETLLDLFRKGTGQLSSAHVDLLIRSCDFLRQLLTAVQNRHTDQGHETEAEQAIQQLESAIAEIQSGRSGSAQKKKGKRKAAEPAGATSGKPKGPETTALQMAITPEMISQFSSEARDLLDQAEQALLILEKNAGDEEAIARAFRALHSLKGNAGLFGYGDLEALGHQVETVLAGIKNGTTQATPELVSLSLETLDALEAGLQRLGEGQEPKISGLQGWLSLLQDCCGANLMNAAPPLPEAEESAAAEAAEIERLISGDCEAVAVPATGPVQERRAGSDRRIGPDRRQTEDRRQESGSGQRQSVRVDVEKLDALLDLVGELVIAEAMVAQNPDVRGVNLSLDRFEKSVLHLEKISRDLQDIITSIRMIPLSGTFRKMIRLVRDLSAKAGKKIELEIVGEETEVDKTVIEQINDPLVHLIRNAVDHGIETPEVRCQSGKSETGRVILEAKYMGSEVWISIKDDGRGLNRDKILAKARERSLVSPDTDLSEMEIFQLIFQPGFSTADKITDISGRGVGMDVVKRNIESLRGRVEVRSGAGLGCTFILRLPLTLAIIDGMVVRVGGARYIIPIVSIKETLQPKAADVTRLMDGQEIVNIRGRLIPVLRLHEVFKVSTGTRNLEDGLILVVENEGRNLCLLVDELIGQQQIVIKGLSRYIGDLPGISGCTILGDGDVSLIIDVAGIFNLAGKEPPKIQRRDSVRPETIKATAPPAAMT